MTQTASPPPDPEEQSLIDAISDPGPGVEVLHPIDPLDELADLAEGPEPDDRTPGPSPGQDDPLPPAAAKAPDTRDRILDIAPTSSPSRATTARASERSPTNSA